MTTPRQSKDLVFTVKNDEGKPVYRIRPYPSTYLHYVIDEYRNVTNRKTGETRVDWVELQCYPSTLEHACTIVRNKLLMKGNANTSELSEVKGAITKSTNQIIKAIAAAVEEVNGRGQ